MASVVAVSAFKIPDVEAGEATPLLSYTNNNTGAFITTTTALETQEEPLPPIEDLKAESLKEKAVTAVASVNFVLALLTLLFQASLHPVVWISSVLGLLVSPLAALQQRKLTEVEALAQTNARLEQEVDQLHANNIRLTTNLQQAEESVYQLQAMQQTLETLQDVQGQSIDELEQQLEESKEILASMHTNYKGQLLQNLITVLLGADDDGNMILSDADIDDIINRLEGLHDVQINSDALRKIIIEHGRSVEAIMEVAKRALMDDTTTNNHNHAIGGSGDGKDFENIFKVLSKEDDI